MRAWMITLLLLVAAPAFAQPGKPEPGRPAQPAPTQPAPAGSLVGVWDMTGENVEDGIVSSPDGELRVERDLGNGRYEGQVVVRFWTMCPQPGRTHDDGSTECIRTEPFESRVTIQVTGTTVRVSEMERDPPETFEYDLEGDRMRFRLESCDCDATTFTYVRRTGDRPAAPRPTPGAPTPAPSKDPGRPAEGRK